MTDGHKHRTLNVKPNGVVRRILTRPTLHLSDDIERVDRSRFVYGPVEGEPGLYRLSPLGVLHGLFGVTLALRMEPAPSRRAQGGEVKPLRTRGKRWFSL